MSATESDSGALAMDYSTAVDANFPARILYATGTMAGASLWGVVSAILEHGPDWRTLPPLLLGLASLVTAVSAYQQRRQEMRHRDEEHLLKIEAERRRLAASRAVGLPDGLRAD